MQLDQMNWFGGFVDLSTSIRASDSKNSLVKYCRLEISVLVACKAVVQSNSCPFGSSLYQRVIIQREELEKWTTLPVQSGYKLYMSGEVRIEGLEMFGNSVDD